MATVFIPPQLRELTGGASQVTIAADTLRDVVTELDRRFPGLQQRLCEAGELAPTLQVSVDQVLTRRLSAAVGADSEVHFLPAIGGG